MGEAKRRKNSTHGTLSDPANVDALVRQAYQQTCAALEACKGNDVDALITSYRGRNMALDLGAKSLPQGVVGCSSGCSACCHQLVMCSPFEVYILAQLLLSTRSVDELATLKERFTRIAKLPLHPNARYGAHLPCPLLENGKCSVYDRRPSVCRAMFSNSRKRCDDALANLGSEIAYLSDPQLMATAMNLGINCALRLKRQFDTEYVELCGSLLVAMENFDASLQEWLQGGSPFSGYRIIRENTPTNAELVANLAARLNL